MFLKYLKDLGLKKIINKSLAQYEPVSSPDVVNTVGILVDETYFKDKALLTQELVKYGIKEENISILVFKNRIAKREGKNLDYPFFSYKDITGGGNYRKEEAKAFKDASFDMLISYYDVEKAPLVLATLRSQAKFKAGFAAVDKRLNHLTISTVAEKYEEFIAELFKYLKILNKI